MFAQFSAECTASIAAAMGVPASVLAGEPGYASRHAGQDTEPPLLVMLRCTDPMYYRYCKAMARLTGNDPWDIARAGYGEDVTLKRI